MNGREGRRRRPIRPRPERQTGPGASGLRPLEDVDRGGHVARDEARGGGRDEGRSDTSRGMERLSDLLPRAAREFGLEDQLEQAQAAKAWDRIVAERVPAAAGACRLAGLSQGVATIEVDLPIVAQELRLRSPELLAALRRSVKTPIRQLHVTTRHV